MCLCLCMCVWVCVGVCVGGGKGKERLRGWAQHVAASLNQPYPVLEECQRSASGLIAQFVLRPCSVTRRGRTYTSAVRARANPRGPSNLLRPDGRPQVRPKPPFPLETQNPGSHISVLIALI